MSHTPGKWKAETAQRGFIITAMDGAYDVAVVRDIGKQDNQANARLIAAAPDLLEALRAILDPATNEDSEWYRESREKARAAIAKAEGRE